MAQMVEPPRSRGRRRIQMAIPNDVLIAIPAYNEERFIGSVVVQARRISHAVVVIDDGSSDQTAQVAEAAGAVVERHPENQGKAEALNTAFRYARESGASILVVLDGDGQHSAEEIRRLVAPIQRGDADIVVGSRFLVESSGDIPRVRRLGQLAITAVTNACSGVPITDSQSGFRAFSRRAIETFLFGAKGFNVEVEMQFSALEHGLRVLEVPITALYLDPPKRSVFAHGRIVLNGVLRLAGRHRPLLAFGLPGLLAFLVGLAVGAITTEIYTSTGQLAIGYALITVLLSTCGLLSMFTAVLLHSIRGTFIDLERRIIEHAAHRSPAYRHG
jgi:glycosyltransferase involved in cell wall biosynthesis